MKSRKEDLFENSRKLFFNYSKTTFIYISKEIYKCQDIFEEYFNDIIGVLLQLYKNISKHHFSDNNLFYFIIKDKTNNVTLVKLNPFDSIKDDFDERYELYFINLAFHGNSISKKIVYKCDSSINTFINENYHFNENENTNISQNETLNFIDQKDQLVSKNHFIMKIIESKNISTKIKKAKMKNNSDKEVISKFDFKNNFRNLTSDQLIKMKFKNSFKNSYVSDILEFNKEINNFSKSYICIKEFGFIIFKNTSEIKFLKTFINDYQEDLFIDEKISAMLNIKIDSDKYDKLTDLTDGRVILFSSIKKFYFKKKFLNKEYCLIIEYNNGYINQMEKDKYKGVKNTANRLSVLNSSVNINDKSTFLKNCDVFSLYNEQFSNEFYTSDDILSMLFYKIHCNKLKKDYDKLNWDIKMITKRINNFSLEIINSLFDFNSMFALKISILPTEIFNKSNSTGLILQLIHSLSNIIIEINNNKESSRVLIHINNSINILEHLIIEYHEISYFKIIFEFMKENKYNFFSSSYNPDSSVNIVRNEKEKMKNKNTNKSFNNDINNSKKDLHLISVNDEKYIFIVKCLGNLFKSFSFVYNLIPKSFNEKIFTNLYFNLFKIKGKDYLSINLENKKYSDLFSTLKVKDFLEFKYVISTLNLLRKSKSCTNLKHKLLF